MKINQIYIVRVTLIVALGGFLMGFDASVISGVVRFIEPHFNLTKFQLGWAVSCLTLTATLAMMLAGPLSDRIGRKVVLQYAAALYFISAFLSALAPSFIVLVLARMIGGLGVGASLIIAPMYIAEISPPQMRGRLVSFNQLNIVIGISVAFFTNYLILRLGESGAAWTQTMKFETYNWRWMLGLESLPALIYFIALLWVPRSPRWLAMKKKHDEALEVLKKAIGEKPAAIEFENILASLKAESKKVRTPVVELFKPALRLVITIGIVIAILQQITGINSVFFYAPMIFEQSGIGTNASFSQAILVGLANLLFTIVAIWLIDKVGRKPLLVMGTTGMAISMLILSYGFHSATYTLSADAFETLPASLQTEALSQIRDQTFENDLKFQDALSKYMNEREIQTHKAELITRAIDINPLLILFGILGFVASFAVSIGPVMWVLFSELFPNRVRGLAISFVGFINSGVSFTVQLVFPWELANFGNALTFLLYGIFAACGLVFILIALPETKGKSLEELEQILVK